MRFTCKALKKIREIVKDPEKRKSFLQNVKHDIKGFMALTLLLTILATPHVGRAEAPLEFWRTFFRCQF